MTTKKPANAGKPKKTMASGPTPELLAAMENAPQPVPNADALSVLKKHVKELRELKFEKLSLEDRVSDINKRIDELKFKELPEDMVAVGLPKFTVDPDGNLPKGVIEAKPYYRANIAADWEADKRAAAFKYLDDDGSGDLIKTQVIVEFPRDNRKKAIDYMERVRKAGFDPITKESISHQTLTAWLREKVEKHKTIPDLEKIGGTVGTVADFKEEKLK